MAKKKAAEDKVLMERTITVPLRRDYIKVPRYRRGKRAISFLKSFLVRHMKSDNIFLGRHANMKIWERGIKNPPSSIRVHAKKYESGKVFVDLEGAPEEKAPEKKTGKIHRKKDSETAAEKKLEEKIEETAEKAKVIEKEEIRELIHEKQVHHAPKIHVKEKRQIERTNTPLGKSEM